VPGVNLSLSVPDDELVDQVLSFDRIAIGSRNVAASHGDVSPTVVHLDLRSVVTDERLVVDRGDELLPVSEAAHHELMETPSRHRSLNVPPEPSDILRDDEVNFLRLGVPDIVLIDEHDSVCEFVRTIWPYDESETELIALRVLGQLDVSVAKLKLDPAPRSFVVRSRPLLLFEVCRPLYWIGMIILSRCYGTLLTNVVEDSRHIQVPLNNQLGTEPLARHLSVTVFERTIARLAPGRRPKNCLPRSAPQTFAVATPFHHF